MDFSKFRESGDLSDITVIINDKEHRLHKFPLYARSDYFCELARTRPCREADQVREELIDFPGGIETFGQVADFCYNMPINLNKNNIIAVRCAAEYLKMLGSGNLVEVSEKYLGDTISASKLNRASPIMIDLILQCKDVGSIAKNAGAVECCIDALVDCWVKPIVQPGAFGGVFTNVTPNSHGIENLSAFKRLQSKKADDFVNSMDEQTLKRLMTISHEWFADILSKARSKGVSCAELGTLAVKFVSIALHLEESQTENAETTSVLSESVEKRTNVSPTHEKDTDLLENEKSGDDTAVLAQPTTTGSFDVDKASPASLDNKADVKEVLDGVLLVLPEEAFDIPAVTLDWLTKVLRKATSSECKCRRLLVRVTGELLSRLGDEDLCAISPHALRDVVVDLDANSQNDVPPELAAKLAGGNTAEQERACRLVDTYMTQMAAKEKLTTEIFQLLASATKTYPRDSHDSLYDGLEFVLNADEDLTFQQRKDLADLLNFDLVSEKTLQRAMNNDIVPGSIIAVSAIKLCERLRSELDSIKYIAKTQEEEIQKYQQTVMSSSNKAKLLAPLTSSTPQNVEARHLSIFANRNRNLDSVYSDNIERLRGMKSPLGDEVEDVVTDQGDSVSSDPMEAAQNVLTAARHKLALPIYTGYRPAMLTRLSPSASTGTHSHHGSHQTGGSREHDITSEDELEFKFDRSFRSLDPRVRTQRLGSGQHHNVHYHHGISSNRTYFPYSHYSSRY